MLNSTVSVFEVGCESGEKQFKKNEQILYILWPMATILNSLRSQAVTDDVVIGIKLTLVVLKLLYDLMSFAGLSHNTTRYCRPIRVNACLIDKKICSRY